MRWANHFSGISHDKSSIVLFIEPCGCVCAHTVSCKIQEIMLLKSLTLKNHAELDQMEVKPDETFNTLRGLSSLDMSTMVNWSRCLLSATLAGCLALMGCGGDSPSTQSGAQEDNTYYETSILTDSGAFTPGIEGPAYHNGLLYVVNFAEQGTIGQVTDAGLSTLFVRLPEGSTGNGIRVGPDGWLYVADYTAHNVLRIDPNSKTIEVYAHEERMNQPNDLAIRSDGTLFASDPNWRESTGNLWRIDTDGSVHLLESDMSTTNGIEVSPDEAKLYLNESVSRKVWQYDLSPDGQIANKRLLIEFPDFGMDGMRCDVEGNLYITRHGKGTVAIVAPDGTLLREVRFRGSKPSNIAFGGADGKTCFVTLQDFGHIEVFRSEYAGRAHRIWR